MDSGMLKTILLILLGMVLIGFLSAIFERLGITNPYLSRVLAAVVVAGAAWTHMWIRLVIVIVLANLFLMVRQDWT